MQESNDFTHPTQSKPKTLSIVIPCYNEKATITSILSVVQNVDIPYHKEIIVVDDCSNDGTREILQSLIASNAAQSTHPPDVGCLRQLGGGGS